MIDMQLKCEKVEVVKDDSGALIAILSDVHLDSFEREARDALVYGPSDFDEFEQSVRKEIAAKKKHSEEINKQNKFEDERRNLKIRLKNPSPDLHKE